MNALKGCIRIQSAPRKARWKTLCGAREEKGSG
jgi:hypothetical protein